MCVIRYFLVFWAIGFLVFQISEEHIIFHSSIRKLKTCAFAIIFCFIFPITCTIKCNAQQEKSIDIQAQDNRSLSTYQELLYLQVSYWQAFDSGNFDEGLRLSCLLRDNAVRMYGRNDMVSLDADKWVRNLEKLKALNIGERNKFCQAHACKTRFSKKLAAQSSLLYPDPSDVSELTKECIHEFLPGNLTRNMPDPFVLTGTMYLTRIYAMSGDTSMANILQRESIAIASMLGFSGTELEYENCIRLSIVEQEAGFPPKTRQKRLEKTIDFFHEEGTKKNRFDWLEYRARGVLADDYYLQGNGDISERMFTHIRSKLPPLPVNNLCGWLFFICSRNDARQACDGGRYVQALQYIKNAEGDCALYGLYSFSKPKAMKQILELKANILRKLGREDEAKQAESNARLIANNLKKVREALSKIEIRIPRVEKGPDGTVRFDFDNPKVIRRAKQ